jgi:cysteine desulfuration protein SufE
MPSLASTISRFQRMDRNMRLETLLDYAERLPNLPDGLREAADHEAHRVTDCQTPVFLWMEEKDGKVALQADIPRESPTVRGYVSIVARALRDMTPAEAAALPEDLLDQLGLAEALGMTRTQGLTAVTRRIRRMAGAMAKSD